MGAAEMAGHALGHDSIRVHPHDTAIGVAFRSGEVHGDARRARAEEELGRSSGYGSHIDISSTRTEPTIGLELYREGLMGVQPR